MKYLKVFTDFAKDIDALSDAEKGRLFTAMLLYAETGQEPNLTGSERFVWPTARKNIDKQIASYEERCVINSKNVSIRWNTKRYETIRSDTKTYESYQEKDKDKDKENIKEKEISKEKESHFVKPSLSEVKAYCDERNNGIDAEAFIAFYDSKGWKIGKEPMKSWKSAIITWEKRKEKEENSGRTYKPVSANGKKDTGESKTDLSYLYSNK